MWQARKAIVAAEHYHSSIVKCHANVLVQERGAAYAEGQLRQLELGIVQVAGGATGMRVHYGHNRAVPLRGILRHALNKFPRQQHPAWRYNAHRQGRDDSK